MFYCDNCANKNRWPKTLLKSQGQCEICHDMATCNDTPSIELAKKSGMLAAFLRLIRGAR